MRKWIIFGMFNYICFVSVFAQSQTVEIKPDFHFKNGELISYELDLNLSFEGLSFIGISSFHFDEDYKHIFYRILNENQWSSWQAFSPQHEMFDRRRTAYEGKFITEEFTAIQFRSPEPLETDLTVRLFMGEKGGATSGIPEKSVSCSLPAICDRTCWCPTCPIDNTPQLTAPTHLIVHHSAGSNMPSISYSQVVEYIWDLHVNTNGWDDLGYNWLIDPDGVLYEGRPDGYQGAHFSCINENTVGICLLGDFTTISPSEEAVNTLMNIIAYETTDHNIDVLAESYHETGDFILSNVAGHRDSSGSENSCSATACPGDTFYPMLDSIRIQVSELDCYQNSVSAINLVDKQSWSVYPNPFQGKLKVEHDELHHAVVEIMDLRGKSCGSLKTGQLHDLNHLIDGVYFLVYQGEIVKKVIKQE